MISALDTLASSSAEGSAASPNTEPSSGTRILFMPGPAGLLNCLSDITFRCYSYIPKSCSEARNDVRLPHPYVLKRRRTLPGGTDTAGIRKGLPRHRPDRPCRDGVAGEADP